MGKENSQETVRSFVFSDLPLKAQQQLDRSDGWSTAAETWLAEAAKTCNAAESFSDVSKYLKELSKSRSQLLGLLQTTSSSPAEVTTAQTRYLALLVELGAMEQQANQATAAIAPSILNNSWFDSILPLSAFADSDDSSTSASSSTPVQGSKWFGSSSRKKQAAAAAAAAAATDQSTAAHCGFACEAANILLAIATWKLAKAGSLIMTQGGADSATAMEAYQLYCQAAGTVEELRRKLLPQLDASSSGGDLSRELVSALHLFALGEAQSVMLQRAVALNYQGSTLAAMATDTAMLFGQAYEALEAAAKAQNLPWTFMPPVEKPPAEPAVAADGSSTPVKNSRMTGFERTLSAELPQDWPPAALPVLQLAAYMQYQLGHCYCLACICASETALSSNQAGQAVALAQLGTNLCEQLQDLGYDRARLIDPSTTLRAIDSARRLGLQATLEQKAAAVLRKCLRENRTIYFQYVPEAPSALPWPQRSAQPEIYRLPTPQGKLTGSTASSLGTKAPVKVVANAAAAASAAGSAAAAATAAAAALAQRSAEASAVLEPVVTDVGRSGRRGRSGKVVQEPNSLALLADETSAVAHAAVAATTDSRSSSMDSEDEAMAAAAEEEGQQQEEGQDDSDNDHAMSSEAVEDCSAADDDAQVLLAEACGPLQLQTWGTEACGVKDKQEEEEVHSPVPSYTLQAGQDLDSRRSSLNGSCDEASRVSSRRCSSADGSNSRRSSSSSSGSSRWSDEGSECSEAGGLGALFKGLLGCCVAPVSFSDDAGDESTYDESEDSEEVGDAWETCSQSSQGGKDIKAQQQWTTKVQKA